MWNATATGRRRGDATVVAGEGGVVGLIGRRDKTDQQTSTRTSRRERRRAARRDAGWMSSYVVATDTEVWAIALADNVPCVVHDLSLRGAGLELAQDDVGVGDQLVLDLQLGSTRKASIQLTGEVRHATPADNGCVRVGVEFVGIGTLEHALLDRLLDDLEQTRRQSAPKSQTPARVDD
jgi:hypothetical protein